MKQMLENTDLLMRWKNKRVNCLGDSITFGAGGTSWVTHLKRLLGFSVVNNYGVNGTTITNNGEDSFLNRYKSMPDADLICVWGGINDFQWCDFSPYYFGDMNSIDDKSFYGALHTLCVGLIDKCPRANIMFMTPMKAMGYLVDNEPTPDWNQLNKLGKKLIDYRNAIIEVCDYYSIPVLDLYSRGGITPMAESQNKTFFVDGLHPNTDGNTRIAYTIASFMNTL